MQFGGLFKGVFFAYLGSRLALLFVVCLYWFAVTGSIMAAHAAQPKIWMSALDPIWRATNKFPPNDWDALFQNTSAWPQVVAHLQVFELSKRFVMESDEVELANVLTFLRQRNIEISIQGTPLLATPTCGLGVEGHGPALDMLQEAQRVAKLGGQLSYISMDEPLFYGEFLKFFPFKGNRKTCSYSIRELASQAAQKIRQVKSVFPNVKVGDVEPAGIAADYAASWKMSLAEWIEDFESATGQSLAYLGNDVVWHLPTWRFDLRVAIEVSKKSNTPIQVIYNASPTEVNWTVSAENHYRTIESDLRIDPEIAFFSTWTDRPQKMLPETDPNTLTGLILQYLKWRKLVQ